MKYWLFLLIFLYGCDAAISNQSGDGSFNDNDAVQSIANADPGDEPVEVNVGDEDDTATNPLCEGTMTVDGDQGFLWKPISDVDGNLVVLFPAEYQRRFLKVEVINDATLQPEEGNFRGFTNGNRQTYNFSMPGVFYTGQVTAFDINQECVWRVEDPGNRQDRDL